MAMRTRLTALVLTTLVGCGGVSSSAQCEPGSANPCDDEGQAQGSTTQGVELDFYHCAVRPFSLNGDWWMVQDAIFDESSKPADLSGTGTATRDGDTLSYTDNAGGSLTFKAVEEEVTRRCA